MSNNTSFSLFLTGAESIFLTVDLMTPSRQIWFGTYDNEDSLVPAADGTRR
jgi:hypothetical protein